MKLHERIFRTICKASVYIAVLSALVFFAYVIYTVLRDDPMLFIVPGAITVAVILVMNGLRYINEDAEKNEAIVREKMEQLEHDVKQFHDEVEREVRNDSDR